MSGSLSLIARHSAGALRLDARFTLEASRTALFGPSGSGKSTVLRILAGLVRPAFGRIVFERRVLLNTYLHIWTPPAARGIGLVTQAPALFPHLSVAQNLSFGLRGLPLAEQAGRVREVSTLLQLEPMQARRPAGLSGGERQRVALARALVRRPGLLLLDEPLSALDLKHKSELWAALTPYLEAHGTKVLLVSHDPGEVWEWAERVIRIEQGVASEQGTPAAMLAREREHVLRQLGG